MNKVTLKEYVNERIADIKHYIEFNERKNDKDFFAHKELELYQNAQKYIELTDELGCPLEVLFKLGELEKNGEAIFIKGETPSEFETFETDNFQVDFSHRRIIVFIEKTDWTDTRVFYFKDYKKTW